MVRRWVGAGMPEAERSFRLVRGCNDMAALVTAVREEAAKRVAEDNEGEVRRVSKMDILSGASPDVDVRQNGSGTRIRC